MNDNNYNERVYDRELAKAYVPFQVLNQVYNQSEALQRGTLFPELYKPYVITDKRDLGGRYNG